MSAYGPSITLDVAKKSAAVALGVARANNWTVVKGVFFGLSPGWMR